MPSTVIPTIRYENCRKMITWLCDTLGFSRHAVHEERGQLLLQARRQLRA